MPTHIVVGVDAAEVSDVSRAFADASGTQGEGHDSQYLGVYDLFLLPEKVKIKFNHVASLGPESDPDDEWDYPEARQFGVLIEAEKTDRPEYIEELVNKLGMAFSVIKSKAW